MATGERGRKFVRDLEPARLGGEVWIMIDWGRWGGAVELALDCLERDTTLDSCPTGSQHESQDGEQAS